MNWLISVVLKLNWSFRFETCKSNKLKLSLHKISNCVNVKFNFHCKKNFKRYSNSCQMYFLREARNRIWSHLILFLKFLIFFDILIYFFDFLILWFYFFYFLALFFWLLKFYFILLFDVLNWDSWRCKCINLFVAVKMQKSSFSFSFAYFAIFMKTFKHNDETLYQSISHNLGLFNWKMQPKNIPFDVSTRTLKLHLELFEKWFWVWVVRFWTRAIFVENFLKIKFQNQKSSKKNMKENVADIEKRFKQF